MAHYSITYTISCDTQAEALDIMAKNFGHSDWVTMQNITGLAADDFTVKEVINYEQSEFNEAIRKLIVEHGVEFDDMIESPAGLIIFDGGTRIYEYTKEDVDTETKASTIPEILEMYNWDYWNVKLIYQSDNMAIILLNDNNPDSVMEVKDNSESISALIDHILEHLNDKNEPYYIEYSKVPNSIKNLFTDISR